MMLKTKKNNTKLTMDASILFWCFGLGISLMFSCRSTRAFSILSTSTTTSTRTCFNRRRDDPYSSSLCVLKLSQQQQQSSSSSLMPQENPDLVENPHQQSLAGISYNKVLQGLNVLYPPQQLESRNAVSRTDGYWPFIQQGALEPPKQYTYGEFDAIFLAQLLDHVSTTYYYNNDNDNHNDNDTKSNQNNNPWQNKVFCDLGSGTGRLVMTAAALHPNWKFCRGIEILESISQVAQETLEQCRDDLTPKKDDDDRGDNDNEEWAENEYGLLLKKEVPEESAAPPPPPPPPPPSDDTTYSLPVAINNEDNGDDNNKEERLALAPIEFLCGSFEDPYMYFGDVDIVFCFSSCMSDTILQSLSQAIGRQCQPGTIVITTDFPLQVEEGFIPPYPDDPTLPYGSYQLELLEATDGYCWLTGGTSTAYIHRVVKSLWDGSGPRSKPVLSPHEKAWRAIQYMEEDKTERAVRFLSAIRNNMVFDGFPEHWWPDPAAYQTQIQAENEQEEI